MPVKNERTIVHPFTGEEITFVETYEETGGAYIVIEVYLPGGQSGPPLHHHEAFTEEFRVKQGMLEVTVEGEPERLGPDETLFIPTETKHAFRAFGDDPVVFEVRLTPGRRFEESMRISYGLLDDGRCTEDGMLENPEDLAFILHLQDTWIDDLPPELKQITFTEAETKEKLRSMKGYLRREQQDALTE
ncbi:cupin domain-containing protein [Alkalicoccus chagannorensis]|uniref:cupin domain-containing protein n=1 Tax=Alkalicoccus chagannorensis TaxID=427072 RepID=UPI000412E7CE|nr:cupin domain-containing protein [Alkalicoccus chagannorensis]